MDGHRGDHGDDAGRARKPDAAAVEDPLQGGDEFARRHRDQHQVLDAPRAGPGDGHALFGSAPPSYRES